MFLSIDCLYSRPAVCGFLWILEKMLRVSLNLINLMFFGIDCLYSRPAVCGFLGILEKMLRVSLSLINLMFFGIDCLYSRPAVCDFLWILFLIYQQQRGKRQYLLRSQAACIKALRIGVKAPEEGECCGNYQDKLFQIVKKHGYRCCKLLSYLHVVIIST